MKIRQIDNYRVVVHPDISWFNPTHQKNVDACKSLMSEIKRHVDGYDKMDWECDEKEVCSFCKSEWEWQSTEMPCCCERAQYEFCITNCVGNKFDALLLYNKEVGISKRRNAFGTPRVKCDWPIFVLVCLFGFHDETKQKSIDGLFSFIPTIRRR